jgi:hypothetical protein
VRKTWGALAIAGAVLLAGPVSATELWDPHLPGSNEGLAAGALPPPGVYGVLNTYWASYNVYNPHANKIDSTSLSALVMVPIVLWSTGYQIFGADYAVAIAQPFDYTNFGPQQNTSNGGGGGNWGTYNTVLVPGQLAWTFDDFHVKTGLTIYAATATSTMANLVNGHWLRGGLPSGNGYWAIQPDLGLSWLSEGWNVSADLHLPIPVSSTTATNYNYRSGVMFEADYTVTKTINKWTFGLGAYQVNQLNSDTNNGVNVHNIATRFGLGPIVGYQFGGINIQATLNESVYTRNDVGGTFFNVRFIVPF